MRIALLNALYAPYQAGGAERSVQILAEGLARRGHAVAVITLGEPHLAPRSVIGGVTVHRLALEDWGPLSGARARPAAGSPPNAAQRATWHVRDLSSKGMSARIGRLLDEERPDILHTHVLMGFSVGAWAEAERRGVPIVHTLRDYYLMCPPATMFRKDDNCARICPRCLPFAAYRRRASRAVDAVCGVSRFILERHLRDGFFARSVAAKVVFNAVAPSVGPQPAKRPQAGLVFGYIGRICPEKGVRWLLEAFRDAPPGHKLVLAGKGDRQFVEALKAEFSSPSVTFTGHVDPAVFYEQVNVVVIPSLWNEPFGRAAIEPLAYGIPVIASNRGGLAELIEEDVTGLVVDPNDGPSLARAIGRFCTDREAVARLGENGKQRLPRFSQEAMTDAYASLYADLMFDCGSRSAPRIGTRRASAARAE